MFISEIEIENYRSIKESQKITLPKIGRSKCFILLGLNESGKSNILRAIALLNQKTKVAYPSDCNNRAEENGEDIQLWFKLEVENPAILQNTLASTLFDKTLADAVTFESVFRGLTISQSERTDYHVVGLENISQKLIEKFLVVEGKIIPRSELLEIRDASGAVKNLLTRLKLQDIVAAALDSEFKRITPRVVVWRSTAEYRITDKIDLDAFKSDPAVSIPLRNCFRIAGFGSDEKINNRIQSSLGSAAKTATLAQLLGEKTTAHINEIWPEHRVSVKFHIDGTELSFLIEDKDFDTPKFEVEQRSDGFKHFISILLNLSAENKTQTLKNRIILLDEPENHLHPSGQRFLRDELLKIAEENTVIFATHSIFMVDTKHLDRHFSVKKRNGETLLTQVEKDNPYREEVLFEALGASILQLIEPHVIIFEGKTDRDIFELYTRKCAKELKPPKVTSISADSVEAIIKYTKFINTRLVKGFVVVDSDDGGKKEKKKILQEPGYTKKNTFEINDILQTAKDSTLEDLFDRAILSEIVQTEFGLAIEFDEAKPFMDQLARAMHAARKAFRDDENLRFKKAFFDRIAKLKKDALEAQAYFKFAEGLCRKIE